MIVPRLVILNPSPRAEKRLVGRTIVGGNLDAKPQTIRFDDGLELLVVGSERDEDGNLVELRLMMPPDDAGLN